MGLIQKILRNPILSGAAQLLDTLTGGTLAPATLERPTADTNPNLLFNSSGEFGLAGWTASGSGWTTTATGYQDGPTFVWNVNNASGTLTSLAIPFPWNSTSVTISGWVFNDNAAGNVSVTVNALNSSGAVIGTVATLTLAPGNGWTYLQATGTTPSSGTTALQVVLYANGGSSGTYIQFNRLKLELSTYPTPYSQEADTNWIQWGAGVINALLQSGATIPAGQTLTNNGTISGGVVNPNSGTVSGNWSVGNLNLSGVSSYVQGNIWWFSGGTPTLPSGAVALYWDGSSPHINASLILDGSLILPPLSTPPTTAGAVSYNNGTLYVGNGITAQPASAMTVAELTSPFTTTSTSPVSVGVGVAIVAPESGNIWITAILDYGGYSTYTTGAVYESTVGIPAAGSAPASGDTLIPHIEIATSNTEIFKLEGLVTGLTPGTRYYFYLFIYSLTSGQTAGIVSLSYITATAVF